MSMKTDLCFYGEHKRFLLGSQPYICMITQEALYLLKKPRGMKLRPDGGQAVVEMDKSEFLASPGLKTYRAEDVTDYRCYVSYDESEPDTTPLDQVQKFATIFFRERESGKRVTLRCICDLAELQALTDPIFKTDAVAQRQAVAAD